MGGGSFLKLCLTNLLFINLLTGALNTEKFSGYIFDLESGEPIFNANIYIPSQDIGTTSNKKGKFTLEDIIAFPIQIEVSHIGYKPLTFTLKKISLSNKFFLEKKAVVFDELVVTASRSGQYRSKSPILTEVINRKDIESSGSKNIADLLRLKSGIFVQESIGGGETLKILGMDSKYVLIMIDSQPIHGKFNNRASLDQISTENIEKIEIVKGPSSSLYGSEAMAGVINIITNKKYEKSMSIYTRIDGNLKSLSHSNFNSGNNYLGFDLRQPIKKTALRMSANTSNINKNQSVISSGIDQTKKDVIDLGIKYALSNKEIINLAFKNFLQNSERKSKLNEAFSKIGRKNFILTYQNSQFTHSISSSNYFRKYSQKRPWNVLLESEEKTTEELLEYEMNYQKKISSISISSGIEVSQAKYQSNRIKSNNEKMDIFSLYSQFDSEHSSKLSTTTGLRVDSYSQYKSVISPRLALLYNFTNFFKFRSSWGLGFRAPSFIEKYIDWNHEQYGYTINGNANLKPESSNGFTISFQYDDSKTYNINTTYYITYFENLIESFTISPGTLSYQNVESAIFEGFEIFSKARFSDIFFAAIRLNWLNNKDGMNRTIPNTIPFSFNTKIQFLPSNDIFSFFANIKVVTPYKPQIYDSKEGIFIESKNKITTYALINMTSNIKWGNSIHFSIGVDNLADYTNVNYGPYIGRKIYFQISSKINDRNLQ